MAVVATPKMFFVAAWLRSWSAVGGPDVTRAGVDVDVPDEIDIEAYFREYWDSSSSDIANVLRMMTAAASGSTRFLSVSP